MDRSENIVLLVRGKYRCEYCHSQLSDELFEIDHIIPLSKRGEDVDNNIAVSCRRCNLLKADRTEWIDRLSGSTLCLFNPRLMSWDDHFDIVNDEILGTSEIGRATAGLLFRDTPQYLPPDLGWGLISGLEHNDTLYYFLNHLRYQRIRNNFTVLEKNLNQEYLEFDLSPSDQQMLTFSKELLTIELYFTRCSVADIQSGLALSHSLVDSLPKGDRISLEAMNSMSILYQQAATLASNKGDVTNARKLQKVAYRYHLAVNPERAMQLEYKQGWKLNPADATAFLRSNAMNTRFAIAQ